MPGEEQQQKVVKKKVQFAGVDNPPPSPPPPPPLQPDNFRLRFFQKIHDFNELGLHLLGDALNDFNKRSSSTYSADSSAPVTHTSAGPARI